MTAKSALLSIAVDEDSPQASAPATVPPFLGFRFQKNRANDPMLHRFYFDIRDGDKIAPDEEGILLPDIGAVQLEAAQSLAEIARDTVRTYGRDNKRRELAIEARDDQGPVLQAKIVFEINRVRRP